MMKRLTILFLLIISAIHFCNAQVSLANDKENIVYIGVNNPISIAAFGYRCNDVTVAVDKGSLERITRGNYIFKINEDSIVNFTVYETVNSQPNIIGKVVFRAKYPPLPIPYINFRLPGKDPNTGEECCNGIQVSNEHHISIKQTKEPVGIVAILNDFVYNVHYQIESFSYSIKRDDSVIAKGVNNGYKCDKDFIKIMNLLQPDDTILFYDIYCKENLRVHIPLQKFHIYIDK